MKQIPARILTEVNLFVVILYLVMKLLQFPVAHQNVTPKEPHYLLRNSRTNLQGSQ